MNLNFAALDNLRKIGDTTLDYVMSTLVEDEQLTHSVHLFLSQKNIKNRDLRCFLKNNGLSLLLSLWEDREFCKERQKKVKAGQFFFEKNRDLIFLLLAFMSLPYCYAAVRGSLVLAKSRRIMENPAVRLNDTAWFVDSVCNYAAFTPDGLGYFACLKTRLWHALVRQKLKNFILEYYNEIPINQEDMAGTLLSFSYLIIRGFEKLGIKVTSLEKDSFLHLWSYIGKLIGIVPELCTCTVEDALKLEHIIRIRHFAPSEHGQALAKSLYSFLEKESTKFGLSHQLTLRLSSYLLGRYVSNCVGINYQEPSYLEKFIFRNFSLLRKLLITNSDPVLSLN